ncbi:uncharacterized protein LOC133298522 [Gastrolobium bilobum]|uniref:uncharacterized protein LOC133298522 n=1 Tax=Gastrolobium bilobum TaxID=150636 RepID=UPI002AAF9B20|nr:uncharacterized protein LOC133298522 [Gastrolobium bilobum]
MAARVVNDSTRLEHRENQLQQHLARVLEEEELLWFQKSMQQWIVDGNRNTKFYYLNTIVRRNHNKITRLKNDANIWIEDQEDLKVLTCEFYKRIFTKENFNRRWLSSQYLWSVLNTEELRMLAKTPSQDEIKRNLFDMGHHKALGVDGFPAFFFQENWDRMKDQISKHITVLWDNPDLLATINSTLLVLVGWSADGGKR